MTLAENTIFSLLAKEWELSGPPGILDISDVVVAVSLAPSETLQTIKMLFAGGFIDMNEMKTSVFLTPEGYAVVDEQHGSS